MLRSLKNALIGHLKNYRGQCEVNMMLGNDEDCICAKPNGKHEEYCDAYRLSEFLKKCASVEVRK